MIKKTVMTAVAVLFVIFFILSAFFVYYGYFLESTQVQGTSEEPTSVDDRISPLEAQGLVLEVLRIRHRGLLEKLLKPGNSWKTKPSFYFISNMDGLEYISKDVVQHGRGAEVLFNTWDTMFQENKIMKNAEEEQATSTVTLTIVERVKSGLLGRRSNDIHKDSLTVTYDYRTGRWSGDDHFNDYDGYGYYLGDTFEIWFNLYQIDFDGDFIPYWTEVNILGTDPTVDDSKRDPDGDGIPTAWEWKWGYDPFTWDDHERLDPDLDGIENIEEYQMEKWLANPFIQEIYYEVDIMERGGLFDPPHYFYEESKQSLIELFAQHNIKCFFDDGWPNTPINGGGQHVPHYEKVSFDSGMMLQFYNNYFPDERKGIFRYLVIGHGGGFASPSKNNRPDTVQIAYLPSRFYPPLRHLYNYVVMGLVPTERGKRIALGSLILHETTHTCSINQQSCDFEGIDNITLGIYLFPKKQYKETWGQYRSVMNYQYTNGLEIFDLSSGENGPPYDQDDWGMMFIGYFQYNMENLPESNGGMKIVRSEWKVPGYTYDANLTRQFHERMGQYSPIDPIKVNWSVYTVIKGEASAFARDFKVFAQPRIKTTRQWVLYAEGDLDPQGQMQFYSFDALLREKLRELSL
jgi:hypothetical protein